MGVTVMLPHGRYRHIMTHSGTMAEMTLADLDMQYLAEAGNFHLLSLFLQSGQRSQVPLLFRGLKQAGMTISLDTNDDPDDRWDGFMGLLPMAEVFLSNELEARRSKGNRGVLEMWH